MFLLYQSDYTCQISDVAESGDGTLEMLALQWWEDQVSCQQSTVGQPTCLRLPSEVFSRSEEASNLNELRFSQCISAEFRVMCFHAAHCVSGRSDRSEGCCTVFSFLKLPSFSW